MESLMCNECLQHKIKSDFSDGLLFCYAISDFPLPLASKAIVKVLNSSGEASSEFVLHYLRRCDDDCITIYVDDHIVDDLECINDNVTDQNDGKSVFSGTISTVLMEKSNLLIGGMKADLYGSHCKNSSCYNSGRSSCLRTISAIAPFAFVGNGSFSTFENIASSLISGSLEDDILCSLSAMIEGKATCRASQNFLSLVGVPLFLENHVPGCLRHPNLVPVFGMLKVPDFTGVVYPKASYTLENILYFTPEALDLEWNRKFLVYQILSALCYIHGLGLSHGNICPSTVMFANSSWVWLNICDIPDLQDKPNAKNENSLDLHLIGKNCAAHNCFYRNLYEDLDISGLVDWPTAFHKWWRGELSNFGYLVLLNKLAGRRWGDHTFHTVMPWVIDFSAKPDEKYDLGWRDLSKSKWRLAKGDEQLDFTYSTSEIPHHVSDECLSELAVCSYKARRLPLSVLRMAVRSVYEPNEYPSTMQRLYQWTPDECIPEFYYDSQIFCSLHSGMSDLAVPPWAGSPQEFIKLHRHALESERVSCEIHKWIDITFGYKMSGKPSLDAKNVMLPSSQPTVPRPIGRRQLFSQPHPMRYSNTRKINDHSIVERHYGNVAGSNFTSFHGNDYLSKIEEASAFCEHAQHLSPVYSDTRKKSLRSPHSRQNTSKDHSRVANDNIFDFHISRDIHCNNLLQYIEEGESLEGYQDLVLWAQQSSCLKEISVDMAKDIFSLGCVIAELYLRKPLFDSISLSTYLDDGNFPGRMRELPPHVKFIVEACIQKDWKRRPSAKCLLECPYFSATVKSSYLFIAPLQLEATDSSRLCYAANFAKKGALTSMGSFAARICATHCLPLLENPLSDVEADYAYILLIEFLKSLTLEAVNRFVLPSIQKILQATGYSHLKVSLLQDSFVREVWNHVGKQIYLEKLHPLVISNLLNSPNKSSSSAASVLLISSSEELGVPISVQQTVLPLIHCFGKGLCADGVDALVRIGVVLGESFIVTQILPLLKNFLHSCVDTFYVDKPEPVQSWNSLALVDCLRALDGLIAFLQKEVIIKKLLEGQSCVFITILMQNGLEFPVFQASATTLVAVCQQIGPDSTAVHVLPQLKQLFDELIFSQELSRRPSLGKSDMTNKVRQEMEHQVGSRMDLVLLLYPSLASLLGIERLRQCCPTWLLLEKYLLIRHNWKWEFTGTSSKSNPGHLSGKQSINQESARFKYNPTKMLMNGVGWTVPQSQGSLVIKDLGLHKRLYEAQLKTSAKDMETSNVGKCEPWFWFSTPASGWDGPDFLTRCGTLKDEAPWKIKASVMHSVRAHHGALRSLAVDRDECTIFTAGVGPGFKGMVQRWKMSTVDCVSGYYGHEEVVNDLCILPSSGRVASCDGTIHVWDNQTGKVISVIAESAANMVQTTISPSAAARFSNDQDSMLNSSPQSSGIFTSVDGSLYTCMHLLENVDKLVAGTGNGSIRFIDAASGKKLHMWNCDSADYGFPSLVSALCSCGSDKTAVSSSHSWIAVGLSSGNCRMLDVRSGCVVASWRAHDGYITKLAAPEDHLLVSSSMDKSLRIWDLRKIVPPEPIVYKGHSDSILDFSVWGQDVISISKNKIGLSSLAETVDEYGQHRVIRQPLYTADRGSRNMSMLSSIAILPFSRLFLVGTEDGQLKICC